MHTKSTLLRIACRAAAFSFALAGTATLMQAQQPASSQFTFQTPPLLLASDAAPANLTAPAYSSSASDSMANDTLDLAAPGKDLLQPPPRRRYGRPNYSDSHTNADGSNKYTFMGGAGLTLPIGDTHAYETPSWVFQVGGGRNFNKNVGVLLQFDYDHFGLQSSTINNQAVIYDYGCSSSGISGGTCGVSGLDGNNHVWSFTVDPTYTLSTNGSIGAYVVVGAGFYHKVTDFTEPGTGEYCDPYYGCYEYEANQVIDHYTSNAFGANGGFGLTYKFSQFSGERLYMEARYVVILNSQRVGYTAANVYTTSYNGYDAYPANSNRTTYIPITFGVRF